MDRFGPRALRDRLSHALVEPITETTHEFCAQIVLPTCAPIGAAMPSATATSTSTRRAIKTFHAHQLSLERNVAPGALTD